MSFMELGNRRVNAARARIRVSIITPKSGRHEMHVKIGRVICDERRWKGGDRVRVLWGTEDDLGLVKIMVGKEGATALIDKSPSFLLLVTRQVPRTERLPDAAGNQFVIPVRKFQAVDCDHHELPDRSIAIRLPREWFEQVGTGAVRKFGRVA